jgi:hypothetical protein
VIFSSHTAPPADATAVDVRAVSELDAIARARRSITLHHAWAHVSAVPWPKGCPDIDDAARLSFSR